MDNRKRFQEERRIREIEAARWRALFLILGIAVSILIISVLGAQGVTFLIAFVAGAAGFVGFVSVIFGVINLVPLPRSRTRSPHRSEALLPHSPASEAQPAHGSHGEALNLHDLQSMPTEQGPILEKQGHRHVVRLGPDGELIYERVVDKPDNIDGPVKTPSDTEHAETSHM